MIFRYLKIFNVIVLFPNNDITLNHLTLSLNLIIIIVINNQLKGEYYFLNNDIVKMCVREWQVLRNNLN